MLSNILQNMKLNFSSLRKMIIFALVYTSY